MTKSELKEKIIEALGDTTKMLDKEDFSLILKDMEKAQKKNSD